MRTTGIFTVHQYEIKFKKYGEPIYIIPFGDIHRSAPLCDEKKWVEFLGWAKKKERCYFLGMGDYDDIASTSERKVLQDPSIHDSTRQTLECTYEKFTKRLANEISFMKGRIIGLIEGNHYATFMDGTTTTQRLCYYLGGCKYLGVTSFIILKLSDGSGHSHRVVIWANHGLGGGKTSGGSINRVEDMEKVAEADIYLMGHDHRKSVALLNKYCVKPNAEKHIQPHIKRVLLARTGTFLRGYVDKQSSYIADMSARPTDLGVVKIELTPKRKNIILNGLRVDEREIDIHASL